MFKKVLSLLVLFVFLLVPTAAQMDEVADIAVINYQGPNIYTSVEIGMLNALVSYGFIDPVDLRAAIGENMSITQEEREAGSAMLMGITSDRLNLHSHNVPDYDLSLANLIVEQALDEEPDAVVVISASLAQIVINNTQTMDDPPDVFFVAVYNPYESGLGASSCEKPDHVTGVYAVNPYEEIVPLLIAQNPDIQTIGTLYNSSVMSGVYGAASIQEVASGLGLAVEVSAVTSLADLRPAAEGLINKGVEAIIMPDDLISRAGLQIVTNATLEHQIPVFYSSPDAVWFGATVGAGFGAYYAHGDAVGVLLASYLNGDLDVATTGITQHGRGIGISINTDVAALQELEISAELMGRADMLASAEGQELVSGYADDAMADMMANPSAEARMEADAAFLASTACADDMG